ncbi:MAG TPA: hypothetical protein VFF06_17490 [Polyangia bacterium]|nr:hypothetical protein [Polyangia bacterium]
MAAATRLVSPAVFALSRIAVTSDEGCFSLRLRLGNSQSSAPTG